MKKNLLMAALAMGVAGVAFATTPKNESKKSDVDPDSVKVSTMNELVVKAVVAPKNAPFAVTKIRKQELEEFSRTGQELPFLFSRTPGVMAWSENGVGTGTSYMRIRGAGDSRINVTLDGVALNSPEDQCVFWANMNSYAAFLGNVQIQRGVGTSTNGDGAFGGSIALQSQTPRFDKYAEVTGSGGSYGTWHVGGKIGTGLMFNHLIIEAGYYHTGTQGYVHGTNGNSGSWFAGATWYNKDRNVKISYKHFGNYEKTGQAWNGVTAGDNDNSLIAGSNLKYDETTWEVAGSYPTGIYTYEDMYNAGLGRFNSLYESLDYNGGINCFANADGTYTTTRYQKNDGTLWDRTTDNFWQNHNLLNATWQINDHWSTNATLHYTYGRGYYDEFRYNDKVKKFGLTNGWNDTDPVYCDAEGNKIKKTDFIRQKGLTQNTYGLVWNLNYQNEKWNVIGGLSMQNFEGNHYGYLTYVSNAAVQAYAEQLYGKDMKYYDSDADKLDAQVFAKATYHINRMFDVYGDLQFRHVGYMTNGINDKFYIDNNGVASNQILDIAEQYNFLNPKAGLSFHNNGHNAYVSYALSHREPERNNFTDNGSNSYPVAESVHDVELGYSYQGKNWYMGLNLYGMFYRNQFVKTGAKSDIGEDLTTNIKSSYRMGLELSFGYNPTSWLTLEGNAAISRNHITDFDETVETYNNNFDSESLVYKQIHYDNSTLAFSPTAILNGFITLHYKGIKATWHTNYVSRQYLDNTACETRMLPHFTTTAIHLSYEHQPKVSFIKGIVYGCDLNNIFNSHYAANGWVYSAIVGSSKPNEDRYTQIGWIPAAGFSVMGSLTLKF